jgi:transcriptional regulator with PAS, ATPase and Fis domain
MPKGKYPHYHRYRKLWLDFTKGGKIRNDVNPPVASSWQRCLESNIDPRGDNVCRLLPSEGLSVLQAARRPFIEASRFSLEVLEKSLLRLPHAILLSDQDGNILYASGAQHVWRYFEECGVVAGGSISEKFLGTTAPGIVLAEKRPAMVLTYAEHYSEIYHWCCCVAAPVLDSAGGIAGSLNITTSGDHFESLQLLLGLNVSTAKCIESELHVMQFLEKQTTETRDFAGSMLNYLEHGIIIIDHRGSILHANRGACRFLKTPVQHLLSRHYAQVIKADALELCFSKEAIAHGKATLLRSNEGKEKCSITAKPLHDRTGQLIGLMAVLEEDRKLWPSRAEGAFPAPCVISDVIGESAGMRKAAELARRFAPSDVPILIYGETGTGKEVFAQAIHNLSNRKGGPFVPLNCAAIPGGLVESELFGYARGAFTGAAREGKRGKFEIASGGTLFLDEIDSMPLDIQAKLLRAIETGEIVSLGDHVYKRVEVRILAAMGHGPESIRLDTRLRKDLFYRISGVRIFLPALRDRSGDIERLVFAFLEDSCARHSREIHRIEPEVFSILKLHDWPGNVRELKSAIEFAVCVADSDTIRAEHLPDHIRWIDSGHKEARYKVPLKIDEMEKMTIERTLKENSGSRMLAAEAMGLSRTTFYRRCKKYGFVERPHRTLTR